MKRIIFIIFFIYISTPLILAQSVQNTWSPEIHTRTCGTAEYMRRILMLNPKYVIKEQQLENSILQWMKEPHNFKNQSAVTIPVVFHIVYNASHPEQNIPDSVVWEQLHVLNSDFAGLNTHSMQVFPDSLKANTGIQFCLAQRDPGNNPHSGIERRATTHGEFNYNDDVKHFSTGGLDQWDPDRFFNIWVCDLEGTLSGYSYYPVDWPLPDVYGAAIDYRCFGISTASPPFNQGHITTHETGHCFHLAHIWGDDHGGAHADSCAAGNCCSGTDHCNDTPNQSVATTGHHTGLLTDICSPNPPGIMYTNFMDYSYDEDLANFTPDQCARMSYFFVPGHYLYMLANSNGCLPPCDTCPPLAGFTADKTFVPFMLDTVNFYDLSVYNPTSWQWSFSPSTVSFLGGTTPGSQNPKVKFNNIGFYDVTLIASNAFGSDTCAKINYINNGAALCDTVRTPALNSCGNNLTYYTAGNWGYITGNNNNGNLEIAQRFDVSTFVPANYLYITNAFVRAIKKGSGSLPDFTYVKLYSVNEITSSPGNLLGTSQPVMMSYINAVCVPDCWVSYAFYPFVEIPSDIFVSVVLPHSYPSDTLVVYSTPQNCYSYDTLAAWEKWNNQSWHTLGSWYGNNMMIDLAVLLNVCNDIVVGDEAAVRENDVIIYPNPLTDNITIVSDENKLVEIININGQLLKRFDLYEKNSTLDLSGITSGIYFLRLTGSQSISVRKIIKE